MPFDPTPAKRGWWDTAWMFPVLCVVVVALIGAVQGDWTLVPRWIVAMLKYTLGITTK